MQLDILSEEGKDGEPIQVKRHSQTSEVQREKQSAKP